MIAACGSGDERGILIVGMSADVEHAGGRPETQQLLGQSRGAAVIDGTNLGVDGGPQYGYRERQGEDGSRSDAHGELCRIGGAGGSRVHSSRFRVLGSCSVHGSRFVFRVRFGVRLRGSVRGSVPGSGLLAVPWRLLHFPRRLNGSLTAINPTVMFDWPANWWRHCDCSVRCPWEEALDAFNPPDFARYTVFAKSSLLESQNHLGDVLDKGYIDEETRARFHGW